MSLLLGFAFTDAALKSLKTIPPKFRVQIMKKAKALQRNPTPQGAELLKGKFAKNNQTVYRIRSGKYRILYIFENNPSQVIILDIGHRKDVYR